MTLRTEISAGIRAEYALASDHGAPKTDEQLAYAVTLLTGVGASQADKVFSDQRTLSASATETLDLTSLTDPFGAALAFAKIKAILIIAAAGNTNDVIVGDAASNPFLGPLAGTTPTIAVKPGGAVLLTAPAGGWAVANGSTDNLKIANSAGGTPVTYDIVLIGTSS